MIKYEMFINKVVELGNKYGFTFLKKNIKLQEIGSDKNNIIDYILFEYKDREYRFQLTNSNKEFFEMKINNEWVIL